MYVHVPTPPPPPSEEVVELSQYLNQVIEAYKEDHPELTVAEVQHALRLSTPSSASRAMVALAIGLAGFMALGVVAFFAMNGSTGGQIPWMILGVGLLTVVFGIVAVARRSLG